VRHGEHPTSNNRSHRTCAQRSTLGLPQTIPRLQELQLVIHYTASTCETLAHGSVDIDVWRKVVPAQALHHEFLMDGILALSALHFACEQVDMEQQYRKLAMHYQDSGLRQFKKALETISAENQGALFAYSIITNILALGFPNVGSEPGHAHVETIIALPKLLHGVGFLAQVNNDSVLKGDYAALFRSPTTIEDSPRFADEIEALTRLRERVDSIANSIEPTRYEAYISAIVNLEKTFSGMRGSKHLGIVIAWPTTISAFLLELLEKGDTMAQFIFIHYGVLLLHARDRWWGKHTGCKLIDIFAASLHATDPEWSLWTLWAREIAANVDERQSASYSRLHTSGQE
jgi:hypothetical protein